MTYTCDIFFAQVSCWIYLKNHNIWFLPKVFHSKRTFPNNDVLKQDSLPTISISQRCRTQQLQTAISEQSCHHIIHIIYYINYIIYYISYNILQYYQSWRDHRLMLPDNMTSEYRLLPVDNHQLFLSTSPNFHFYIHGLLGSWIWPNRLGQIGALLVDQWYEKSSFAIGGFRSKFLPDWMFDGWIICNWWFAIKMSPGWMAVRDLATRFLLQECQECDLSGRFPFNKLCNSEWCKIFINAPKHDSK